MSTTIDQSFVMQFESDVHLAYQRMGSKLRNTVRTKTNVKGKSTTFQKVGAGTAGEKARHGQVPIMNLAHAPVECLLKDYYAGEFIDELSVNHGEKMVAADACRAGKRASVILPICGALTIPSVSIFVRALGVASTSGAHEEHCRKKREDEDRHGPASSSTDRRRGGFFELMHHFDSPDARCCVTGTMAICCIRSKP